MTTRTIMTLFMLNVVIGGLLWIACERAANPFAEWISYMLAMGLGALQVFLARVIR